MTSPIDEKLRSEPAPHKSDEMRKVLVGLVGNVITQPFSKIAVLSADYCDLTIRHLDFGQVAQSLMGDDTVDFLIVHLDYRWFFDVAPNREAIERARELVDLANGWLDRTPGSIILNTIAHVPRSPIATDRLEQIAALAEMNELFLNLGLERERAHVVDVAGILALLGHETAIRERNRLVMQHPYAPVAVQRIAAAYADAIVSTLRARRKVIVLDADNTLWGGVLGEDGANGVKIDKEYPGVLYVMFQNQLLRLKQLGFLLCVVTKNNEADFLELFNTRSLPLKLEDFVAWRSNWEEKSYNIIELAKELNLGLDSFVFIDDNPFEIEEVRARLSGVECHLFPHDSPEDIISLLDRIASLRAHTLTAEDLVKTEQYRVEAERKSLAGASASLDDYLASLEIKVHVCVNEASHVSRIAQLTNKTNQFNLTTRRYTEPDIRRFMAEGHVYDFRVVDRFGDMGIVGVAIIKNGDIDTFLMSCRALGRKIESGLLRYIIDDRGEQPLTASYRWTAKNSMVADFFDQNGFERVDCSENETTYVCRRGPDANRHFQFIRN